MSARSLAMGARLALGTFTVAPVRAPSALDPSAFGLAMRMAPAVGLLLAAAASAVLLAARVATDVRAPLPLLPAVLAVVSLALLTRGLHLDGLADTADGLGSMRAPEDAIAVMRAPDIGPFGVSALLLVLLTQVAALTYATAAERGTDALVVAVVTGRLAVMLSCTPATRAASRTGLGAAVAGSVTRRSAFTITALALVGFALLGLLDDDGRTVTAAVHCVVAAVVGLAVAHAIRWHAVRRLGGITGDVLGAIVEATTAVSLIGMALF